jgi:MoaA/NifB/PqqE/SkfB family radical SAM enzyme
MPQSVYKNIPIVAIRSLYSAHHASTLPPRYISLLWNIGKRCNYDCSYCSPHVHDAISPHLSLTQAVTFLNNLDQFAKKTNKSLDFSITGGEPFANPDILGILKYINDLETTSQRLVIVTNGSLPLVLYQRAMDYVTSLTVSVHLERTDDEISKVISNILSLRKIFGHEKFINVNLMCLPGRFNKVEEISQQFIDHDVKYVLRRIRPNFDDDDHRVYQPHERKRIKKWALLPLDKQIEAKHQYKIKFHEKVPDLYADYYSEEEHSWISKNMSQVWWQNIGLWYEDGSYTEANTDDIVSRNLTGFKGWTCWAGVDQLMVDFDGSIWRGQCKNRGRIGHVLEPLNLPTEPTTCDQRTCVVNGDISQRKAINDSWHKLIS